MLVLRFYADLPLGDVADILDIPIGTAKSRLHRGLATLRSTLDAPSATGVSGVLAQERLA